MPGLSLPLVFLFFFYFLCWALNPGLVRARFIVPYTCTPTSLFFPIVSSRLLLGKETISSVGLAVLIGSRKGILWSKRAYALGSLWSWAPLPSQLVCTWHRLFCTVFSAIRIWLLLQFLKLKCNSYIIKITPLKCTHQRFSAYSQLYSHHQITENFHQAAKKMHTLLAVISHPSPPLPAPAMAITNLLCLYGFDSPVLGFWVFHINKII